MGLLRHGMDTILHAIGFIGGLTPLSIDTGPAAAARDAISGLWQDLWQWQHCA